MAAPSCTDIDSVHMCSVSLDPHASNAFIDSFTTPAGGVGAAASGGSYSFGGDSAGGRTTATATASPPPPPPPPPPGAPTHFATTAAIPQSASSVSIDAERDASERRAQVHAAIGALIPGV